MAHRNRRDMAAALLIPEPRTVSVWSNREVCRGMAYSVDPILDEELLFRVWARSDRPKSVGAVLPRAASELSQVRSLRLPRLPGQPNPSATRTE
jgi:hypothetical protein